MVRKLVVRGLGLIMCALLLAGIGYRMFLMARASTFGFGLVIVTIIAWPAVTFWLKRIGAVDAMQKFILSFKKSN